MANTKKRTKRIYYGPEGHETSMYWTVKVSDAKKSVSTNGSIIHALKGYPGMTIGCGLSNMAIDKNNAPAFPHPVYLASFTKSTALVVDKLKNDGSPEHAVLYHHSYGRITDHNDDGTLKRLVKQNPALIERSFTLRVPRKSSVEQGPNSGLRHLGSTRGKTFVPRGALQRAMKAGRIGRSVAEQLAEVALATPKT